MSERILKALMQLFSIIARVDEAAADDNDMLPNTNGEGRKIVEELLGQELNSTDVQEYLQLFDDFLFLIKEKAKKRTGNENVHLSIQLRF